MSLRKRAQHGGLAGEERGRYTFHRRFWKDCWLQPPDPMMLARPYSLAAEPVAGDGDSADSPELKGLTFKELYLLRPTYIHAPEIFFPQ